LQQLVKAGHVRVDGAVVRRANQAVAAGAEVAVEVPDPSAQALAAADEPLSVLFADEELLVIDKPAGLITHANAPGEGGSLAERAQAQYGPLPDPDGHERPGVVHRLDRMTSGVIVMARTQAALEALKLQFQERRVAKEYVALVAGDPRFDSDWIDAPIAPVEGHYNRFRALPVDSEDEGRPASTFYEVTDRLRGYAHLTCRPKTGRTHQIRVHLASIGLPILMDQRYARSNQIATRLPAGAPPLERQALHARRLEFQHPRTSERVAFEAPLAPDMQALLDWLRANASA